MEAPSYGLLVVPYLFSREEPLTLVSVSETIISCNTQIPQRLNYWKEHENQDIYIHFC